MNRSVLESSPVQQFGTPNWWNVSGGLRTQPPLMGHQQAPHMTSSSPSLPKNPNLSSWLQSNDLPPESWSLSQLLLGGLMMGEEERLEMMNHHNHHDEQLLNHQQASMVAVEIKQESNINNNNGCYVLSSPNSPPNKSCVTTSLNSNEDNNNNLHLSRGRHTPPDRSSECNSLEIGGSSNKKPRLQPSHSSQSTLKVRKEKLGGRIAALHQLVSPFGKTDTASVLSEAIGYIRFLHSQIEALSHPYFGTTTSGIMMHQQELQGDGSCIFTDEDSDQVVNTREAFSSSTDNQNANEEPKKDLRSRGLTLVPISCILQVDTDNGADYWAPALSPAGFL